jgi:hypothetical protein
MTRLSGLELRELLYQELSERLKIPLQRPNEPRHLLFLLMMAYGYAALDWAEESIIWNVPMDPLQTFTLNGSITSNAYPTQAKDQLLIYRIRSHSAQLLQESSR